MFTFLGDLERLLADLYPYRYPITATLAALTVAVIVLAARSGLPGYLLRHRLSSTLIGVPLLAISVFAGNHLLSPLWEKSYLNESSPVDMIAIVMPQEGPGIDVMMTPPKPGRQGMFSGADDFHFARGDALLIETSPGKHVIRFENFSVRNGPDLYVYLSNGPTGRVEEAQNLGRLKATSGNFNYEVPTSVDIARVKNVLVWCRQFGVLFGSAPIEAM